MKLPQTRIRFSPIKYTAKQRRLSRNMKEFLTSCRMRSVDEFTYIYSPINQTFIHELHNPYGLFFRMAKEAIKSGYTEISGSFTEYSDDKDYVISGKFILDVETPGEIMLYGNYDHSGFKEILNSITTEKEQYQYIVEMNNQKKGISPVLLAELLKIHDELEKKEIPFVKNDSYLVFGVLDEKAKEKRVRT